MPQPAAGNFVVTDWVATEAVRLLSNSRETFEYATYNLEANFEQSFQINDTVRYKYPQMFNTVDGPEFQGGSIDRRYGQATIDQWVQVPMEVAAWDKMLRMEKSKKEMSAQYIRPAMEQMLTEAEQRFCRFMFLNTNNVVGALGTTPTTWATYAGADTRLFDLGGLQGKQGNLVSSKMVETMISNQLTQFSPVDEISKEFKRNVIGDSAGARWHKTIAVQSHTSGVWTTVLTGVTVTTSGQSGNTINVTCTTGDTFKAGDIITFANSKAVNPWVRSRSLGYNAQFKIMSDTVGVASAATLSIYPALVGPGSPYQNVTALPAAGDVVNMWPGTTMVDATAKTGILGFRVNPNAFGVISRPVFVPPQGGSILESGKDMDDETGMSVSYMHFHDPRSMSEGFRWDMVMGFAKIYSDRAACLIAGLS